LRQAIATDPAKPMLRLDLAKVLAEAGRRDEARAEYEALLRLVPNDSAALTGQAAFLAEQGDLAGAERGLRQALTHQPGDVAARFNLAEVLVRLGRAAEARTEWQRVLADPQATPALRTAARHALDGAR
jgi:Flp pilus assembly protein TadD